MDWWRWLLLRGRVPIADDGGSARTGTVQTGSGLLLRSLRWHGGANTDGHVFPSTWIACTGGHHLGCGRRRRGCAAEPVAMGPRAQGPRALTLVCSIAGMHRGDSIAPSLAWEPAAGSVAGPHLARRAPAAETGFLGPVQGRGAEGPAVVAGVGGTPTAGVAGGYGEVAARSSTLRTPSPQARQGRGGKGMENTEGEGEGGEGEVGASGGGVEEAARCS